MNQDNNNQNNLNNGISDNQPFQNNLNNVYTTQPIENNNTYQQSNYNQSINQNINNQPIFNSQPQNIQQSINQNVNSFSNFNNNQTGQPQSSINIENITPTPITNDNKEKPNKKMLFILIPIIVIIIIIIGVVLLSGKGKNNSSNLESLDTNNNIIVKNQNNEYALFNSSGKQLTKFEYKSISEFKNNVAIVQNKDGNSGLIDHNGKFVVDFGKYNYIQRYGYLYKANDKDYNEYLLNSKGEILYQLGSDKATATKNYVVDELIVVDDGNNYDVLNYKGQSLIKINKVGNMELTIYEDERDINTIFYNNITYVIDLIEGEIINKISSSNPYCVKSINNLNRNEYVVSSCDNNISTEFKYYNGNSLKFTSTSCTNLFFEYNNENLICAEGYNGRYLMTDEGKKGIEIYNSNISYIDYETYIENGDNNTTKFYKNGKEKANVECSSTNGVASRTEKIYILKNKCSDNKNTFSYYDESGNKITNKNFKTAIGFDINNITKASEDGKSYYLMDTKGNKISDYYDKIDFTESSKNILYEATKNGVNYLLNINGKEVISTSGRIDIYNTHFTISENGVISYYSLQGKEVFRNN